MWFEADESLVAVKPEPISKKCSHSFVMGDSKEIIFLSYPRSVDPKDFMKSTLFLEPGAKVTLGDKKTFTVVARPATEYARLVPLVPAGESGGWRIAKPLSSSFVLCPDEPAGDTGDEDPEKRDAEDETPKKKRQKRQKGTETPYSCKIDDDVLGEETPANTHPATPLAALKTRWRAVGATPDPKEVPSTPMAKAKK